MPTLDRTVSLLLAFPNEPSATNKAWAPLRKIFTKARTIRLAPVLPQWNQAMLTKTYITHCTHIPYTHFHGIIRPPECSSAWHRLHRLSRLAGLLFLGFLSLWWTRSVGAALAHLSHNGFCLSFSALTFSHRQSYPRSLAVPLCSSPRFHRGRLCFSQYLPLVRVLHPGLRHGRFGAAGITYPGYRAVSGVLLGAGEYPTYLGHSDSPFAASPLCHVKPCSHRPCMVRLLEGFAKDGCKFGPECFAVLHPLAVLVCCAFYVQARTTAGPASVQEGLHEPD